MSQDIPTDRPGPVRRLHRDSIAALHGVIGPEALHHRNVNAKRPVT